MPVLCTSTHWPSNRRADQFCRRHTFLGTLPRQPNNDLLRNGLYDVETSDSSQRCHNLQPSSPFPSSYPLLLVGSGAVRECINFAVPLNARIRQGTYAVSETYDK